MARLVSCAKVSRRAARLVAVLEINPKPRLLCNGAAVVDIAPRVTAPFLQTVGIKKCTPATLKKNCSVPCSHGAGFENGETNV